MSERTRTDDELAFGFGPTFNEACVAVDPSSAATPNDAHGTRS